MSKETAEERVERFKKDNGIFFFKPYPWQKDALVKIREKNTTAIISSNKIGKCITYQTLIDTPDGKVSVGRLHDIGKPFDVFAWDGKKKVIAKAHAPFKKHGLHKCYRITMSDGQTIDAADHHKILTYGGWRSFESLHKFVSSHPQSSSDISPSIHGQGALHLNGKEKGSPGYYQKHRDFCGGQLPSYQEDDQVFFPLPHGFRSYIPYCCSLGDLVKKHKRTLLSLQNDLLYRQRQFVGRLFEFLTQTFGTSCLQLTSEPQGFQLPCGVASSGFQQDPLVAPHSRDTVPSCCSPLLVDNNHIISSIKLGSQEVYDFTVDKWHNYFAGGLIHHNSCLVTNILISWLIGFEPWDYIDKDDPEAIEVHGQYYRKSSLGIEPPVNLILTGEDWKLHIGRTLVPELKKWAPKGWYKTKKNEQGVDFLWTFCDQAGKWDNVSTLTIMSYSQDDDLFESFRAQGAILDEPPPKAKYKAMSRGLLLDNGKTLLSLTPIKEAWILDDIVLSGRKDIGIVDNLKITDNPDLVNGDVAVLNQHLDESQIEKYFDLLLYENKEKNKPVVDQGRGAEMYLEGIIPVMAHADIYKLKILKFIKDIDPADVPPRVFGMFKSLVGRVLKEFDRDIHVVKRFDVPTDWPVTVMIDFHLSTPQAVSYWAVNRQDINYCVGETWKNISGDEIADDIIRKLKAGWNITEAFIDPLSKGDVAYIRNRLGTDQRDTFSIIGDKLLPHGITLQVASKDKDSGVKNLQTWLKGVNGLPTCYIFEDCERFLYEVQRWVFDENGKPAKENDHMCENAYRYTLVGAKYEAYQINPLPMDNRPYATGAWMGA